MNINRRWIAREWLYLLAGFVCYILGLVRLPVPFLGFLLTYAYVFFQLWRITRWAIRTLREPE